MTGHPPVRLRLASLACAALGALVLPACDSCNGNPGVTSSGGRILFEPDTADFGYVLVGQQKELKIGVKNTGRGTLKIRSIDRGDGFPDEIRYTPPRLQLEPGEQQFVTLLFQPSQEGARSGTLAFRNDSADDPVELAVRGVGIRTHLVIDPATVDFGPVILDDVGERTASLENQGTSPVEVFVDALGGDNPEVFRVILPGQDQRHLTLEAGGRLDLALSFQPLSVGNVSARFNVRPCASCDPTQLGLVGKGIAAGLVADPEELNFGAVLPNTRATRSLTFKNVGNKRIAVTAIRPAQAGTEFAVVQPAHWPDLDPGAQAAVEVTYQPTNLGPDATRLVVETDDARAPRFEVPVLGYGGGPSIDVLPAGLEYNDVAVGFPVKRRVSIVNKGLNDPNSDNDNLVVDAIDLPPGDFAWTVANGGALPLRIAPGDRAVLEVTYSPTIGEARGTMVLHSNDGDHLVVSVPLHGNGKQPRPCDYELVPDASRGLQFGVVQRGRSSRLSFSLRNVGPSQCVVGQIDLDGAGSTAFRLTAGPVYGKLLEPGERVITEVEFAPPGNAPSGTNYAGAVVMRISSTRAPEQQVQLTGRGAEVCLSITPTGVDFGVVKPNCETNDRTFSIYNACSTPVRIDDIRAGQGGVDFRVLKPNLPVTLAPQQDLRFNARYSPAEVGPDTGTIEVYTNQAVTGNPPQPYVLTMEGRGDDRARETEDFTQADQARADILFVVDDSGSMDTKQRALAANFAAFMKFARDQQIDYHIAVTTTGATDGDSSCGPPDMSDTPNGRFMPLNGASRIVTPTLPDPDRTFATNVHVGLAGCTIEQGLEGAYEALSDPNINGTNAGFLRNDAYLSIIIVSDADDQSTKPVDFYVNFFQNIKGPRGANLVSVSAIVNYDDSICRANPIGLDPGAPRPVKRYPDVVKRTGGVLGSICTSDWAATLQKLGLTAFGYKSRFVLNSEPAPATLQVFIDGVEVPAGPLWSYSPDTNSVDFLPTAIPPAGAPIKISYAVACH